MTGFLTYNAKNRIVYDVLQGTPEWHQLRCGIYTASAAKAMLATVKNGEAASRRDLRTRLAVERLTNHIDADTFENEDILRGQRLEPVARRAYEALTGSLVDQVGFIRLADAPVGFSPDGLIGDDGGLELKAPRSARHFGYLRGGGIPTEHRAQLLHSLYVSGRDWWDFASYDELMPNGLKLFVCRLQRDDAEIADYHAKVVAFLVEIDAEVAEVQKLVRDQEPAF